MIMAWRAAAALAAAWVLVVGGANLLLVTAGAAHAPAAGAVPLAVAEAFAPPMLLLGLTWAALWVARGGALPDVAPEPARTTFNVIQPLREAGAR